MMGPFLIEPATIIARGASSTTIVRSDEVAARVMQNAVRSKGAGDARPVTPTERRDDQRPFHSDRGIDALRRRVGEVADLVAWLQNMIAALDPDVAYLAVAADEPDTVAIVTEILVRLREAEIEPTDELPGEAPVDLTIQPIVQAVEIDLGSGVHLSLVQWGQDDMVPLSARDGDNLHLLLTDGSAASLLNTQRAGSVCIRMAHKEFVLKSPPERAITGLMDVIL